jgi:3-deoxy-D-manno-octulosonate 8-phosphate phosphatase (KDO 8-P phosphatase)
MIPVRAVALDVDGVLTDGGVWWGPNGEEWKRFSFRDIMGVSLARKAGVIVALISAEDSPLVDRFAAKMGITDVAKGSKDKAEALRRFAANHQLALADVHPSGLRRAAFVATYGGGHGAVRELLDAVVAARQPAALGAE